MAIDYFAGDLYIADDPENAARAQRAVRLADRYYRAFVDGDTDARSWLAELIGDLGADCQIGPNVQLLTPTHPIDPRPRRDKLEAAKPITLGDNVWLGGGVIVCPGVTIGEDSVLGAGAVVTRDIPAGVVAVGNPARVFREI